MGAVGRISPRPPAGRFFLLGLGALVFLLLALELDSRLYRWDSLPAPSMADVERLPYLDRELDTEERIHLLLGKMRLDEKIRQLHGSGQMRTHTNRRLRIPALQATDGPHGIGEAVWRYLYRDADRATVFPVSIALGSTWDPRLAYEVGAAIAREAKAKGRNWLLAPDINIVRDPRGGRSFESFSEDPYLTARLGVGFVRGAQNERVIATPKHFVAHHQETHRRNIDVRVGERALREIYLPAFRAAVREGGALSVMAASHSVNGLACTENELLLRQVLKQEWGFGGLVVSDWKCMRSTESSLQAGLDVEMPKPLYYGPALAQAVAAGRLDESQIDDSVRRVLRTKLLGGLFDEERRLEPEAVHTHDHRNLALEVARTAIVLLKNERRVLPLRLREGTLAVLGPNAAVARLGGRGSSTVRPFSSISPLEGIRQRAPAGLRVEFLACCSPDPAQRAAELERALETARTATAVVLVMGFSRGFEGESLDRVGHHLRLPLEQVELIRALTAVNAKTVVVLVAGSAVAMPTWGAQAPAILHAWYGGEQGGLAIAEVLFGEVNPAGKLPITFPKSVQQVPGFEGFGQPHVSYDESIFVGYRYQDHRRLEPLFPFGHGLSYTEFSYRNLGVEVQGKGPTVRVTVAFEVHNTGERSGTEIVQVYVSDLEASLERPPKELKAFERIPLEPGESRRIEAELDWKALSFWDPTGHRWVAETGDFEVRVGSSSRDIRLRRVFSYEDAD